MSEPNQQAESHAVMNHLLAGGAKRAQGVPTGGVAALSGESATESENAARSARLRAAVQAHERAERVGDELAADYYDRVVDDLLAQTRQARKAQADGAEQPRDPETGQFASFDGGARGRPPAPEPPSGNDLLYAAVRRHRENHGGPIPVGDFF